ncbi:MAG: U32 family peptidase [Oscillospiraceae bacterium]|nr:U32 family peptidase [Oscillospiraceae bacterium]
MRKKIELLAPAGNLEILKAAVDMGADAVYCGLGRFNARVNADNFDIYELEEAVDYAHLRSSKVYLTVNTLMNNMEFDEFLPDIAKAVEIGVDGLIVADCGVLAKLAKAFPDVLINASTQMNVFSEDEFYNLSKLGVNRIVLPRELTMDEIASRTAKAAKYGMDTEVFAHGAVCVCVSGLCLFSAMNKSGTRSGNRGTCAQPCREEYALFNDGLRLRKGHLLSPKDRDVTDYIGRLIDSGVASLKLEGRMREISYVRSCVRAYRTMIDAYYDGVLDEPLKRTLRQDLLVNFNRGGSYTSQALSGNKDSRLLSGEFPGKYGLQIGKIIRTDRGSGEIRMSFGRNLPVPSKGDYLSIRKDKTVEVCSFPIGKMEEAPDHLNVKGLHPDMFRKIEPGMDVFLMNHTEPVSRDELRRTPIKMSLTLKGSSASLEAVVTDGSCSGVKAVSVLSLPKDYQGSAIDPDRIRTQLKKTLDTPFEVVDVQLDGNADFYCPVSFINELRRELISVLEDKIRTRFKRSGECVIDYIEASQGTSEGKTSVMYTYPTIRLNEDILKSGADIYCMSLYDMANPALRKTAVSFIKEEGAELALMLPGFYHDRLIKTVNETIKALKDELGDKFTSVITSQLFEDSKKYKDLGLKKYVSSSANIYSSDSLKLATGYCDGLFMSSELSAEEIMGLADVLTGTGTTLIVHSEGEIPWMQSDFCCCGQNAKDCHFCEKQSLFALNGVSSTETRCYAVPHRADCSCTIYGPSRNLWQDMDYPDCDIIVNHTFLPKGENNG